MWPHYYFGRYDMTRRINQQSLDKLKQWEGLKLKAYRDVAGVLTIGYGSTGTHVKSGMVISEKQAETLLKKDLDRFERAVDESVKVELSDNQFGALVSFAFNVGVSAFKNSTLLKKLNAGDYYSVPSELARWNKAGGKVVQGLVNRRAAEAGLWARGAFVSSAPVYAQVSKPSIVTTENAAVVGTVVSSIAAASSSPGPLQWAFAVILVIAAITAAVAIVKKVLE